MYVCPIYTYECDVLKLCLIISMRETTFLNLYSVPSKNKSLSHPPHTQRSLIKGVIYRGQNTVSFHSFSSTSTHSIQWSQTHENSEILRYFYSLLPPNLPPSIPSQWSGYSSQHQEVSWRQALEKKLGFLLLLLFLILGYFLHWFLDIPEFPRK